MSDTCEKQVTQNGFEKARESNWRRGDMRLQTRIAEALERQADVLEKIFSTQEGPTILSNTSGDSCGVGGDGLAHTITAEQRERMMSGILTLAQAPRMYLYSTVTFEPFIRGWDSFCRNDIKEGEHLILVDAAQLRETLRSLSGSSGDQCEQEAK